MPLSRMRRRFIALVILAVLVIWVVQPETRGMPHPPSTSRFNGQSQAQNFAAVNDAGNGADLGTSRKPQKMAGFRGSAEWPPAQVTSACHSLLHAARVLSL
eukprot:SAG31_NODE_179_length_21090_cov_11.862871_21_plen_101_part_00